MGSSNTEMMLKNDGNTSAARKNAGEKDPDNMAQRPAASPPAQLNARMDVAHLRGLKDLYRIDNRFIHEILPVFSILNHKEYV